MTASPLIPHQFQHQSLSLISSLLPVSNAVFFLVEPGMQHRGAVIFNGAQDMEKQYTQKYSTMDPLSPDRFRDKDTRVATLDSQIAPHLLKQSRYYQEFMLPNEHRYVADMFFRLEGTIVAILSILRAESLGNFTASELELLNSVQPFMEYSLNTVYLPRRQQERQGFHQQYQLTERELDVLELLMSGANNKQIATELNLGLATVKTHLHHIFQKTGVQSRAELVSRSLQLLQAS
ncbi:helix-turn-helix transcriptional regulator [Aliamphritea spongicola]|uniref:helix-turn-helix transcriptional regulator n=1 Tax=Aliamphritea spongicola TaxID=707589 RepID=UPI00196AA5FA|nr:LuxR C-terminal-related transcriptional regulator [Aliamphritea spongicola]MBN3560916.1 LuxR family transcriptional regulator [Aliamphritea spongicola]